MSAGLVLDLALVGLLLVVALAAVGSRDLFAAIVFFKEIWAIAIQIRANIAYVEKRGAIEPNIDERRLHPGKHP